MVHTLENLPPPTEMPNAANKQKGKRGIVTGRQSEKVVSCEYKGAKIKMAMSEWHSGLAEDRVHKLIRGDIGAVIRDRCSMLASSFIELGNQNMKIVFDFVFVSILCNLLI